MRALRNLSVPLMLLALAPLGIVAIQTLMLDFPTARFLGAPYSPWPAVLIWGVLITLALGGLLCLLRRAVIGKGALARGFAAAAGFVLVGLSVLSAEMAVINEWVAAQVSGEGLVLNLINQAFSLPGQLAIIPAVLVGLVVGVGAAFWLWRSR